MAGTRERMVVSTALLMRERGARATSLDAVLEHSGAPRGSIYHHFPGGRTQLLREATDYAGRYVERRLVRGAPRGSISHHSPGGRTQLLREATDYAGRYVERRLVRGAPLEALDALFDEYRENLLASDFRAGCPVVALAVESGEAELRDDVRR